MGKNNRQMQPQTAARPRSARRCDWCRNLHDDGNVWDGQWVCADCFPTDIVKKKQEDKKQIKQCSCGRKSVCGQEILGQWLCDGCCRVFRKSKKHKNKYANYSHVDHHPSCIVINPKTKPKRKGLKLKKIVYWKVIITDISDGKL